MTTYPAALYCGAPPHETGSETSRLAADSVAASSASLREQCAALLRSVGPLTVGELEERTGRLHQSVGARVRELVLLGRVTAAGERRRGRSGRWQEVWRVVKEGEVVPPPAAAAPSRLDKALLAERDAIATMLETKATEADVFVVRWALREAAETVRARKRDAAALSLPAFGGGA